jgi:hypothetical protein
MEAENRFKNTESFPVQTQIEPETTVYVVSGSIWVIRVL